MRDIRIELIIYRMVAFNIIQENEIQTNNFSPENGMEYLRELK